MDDFYNEDTDGSSDALEDSIDDVSVQKLTDSSDEESKDKVTRDSHKMFAEKLFSQKTDKTLDYRMTVHLNGFSHE